MKLLYKHSSFQWPILPGTVKGFTLVELMTTLGIFCLVVIAMVSLQIFGFKLNSFTSIKLKATSDSLNVLGQIGNAVLEATGPVVIGNYNVSNSVFTAVASGQADIGNALQFQDSSSNTVTFYLNTNTRRLYELAAGNQPTLLTLSSSIINSQPFQAMSCFGINITAGSSMHYTIKTTLLFSNLVYAVPTSVYDTYRVESSVTPREQYMN